MDCRALVFIFFLSFFYFALAIPSDERFPLYTCIVDSEVSVPDCNELTNQKYTKFHIILNEVQYIYASLEQAINKCPYDPMVIYMVGTNYVPSRTLIYNQTKDLHIIGYGDKETSEKSILVGLSKVTVVNSDVKVLFGNMTFYECPDDSNTEDFLSSLESE